jgi:hypothetical protein
MGQERCPYEGVVGETALTFDASAIVFSVVGDTHNSILLNDIQSLVHFPPPANSASSPLPTPRHPVVSSAKYEKI